MSDKGRSFNEHRAVAVSLCAPAVRMLLLHVGANVEDGEHWIDIMPVIALAVYADRHYSCRSNNGHYISHAGTEKELLECGWVLETQQLRYEPLVCGESDDLSPVCDMRDIVCSNTVVRVIACPWPAAEDEERLKGHLAQLIENAWEKVGAKKPLPQLREASCPTRNDC